MTQQILITLEDAKQVIQKLIDVEADSLKDSKYNIELKVEKIKALHKAKDKFDWTHSFIDRTPSND